MTPVPPTPPQPTPQQTVNQKFLLDAAERVLATAAEAGISAAIVAVSSIPKWWVAPITVALAGVKSFLAKFVGSSSSASLVK